MIKYAYSLWLHHSHTSVRSPESSPSRWFQLILIAFAPANREEVVRLNILDEAGLHPRTIVQMDPHEPVNNFSDCGSTNLIAIFWIHSLKFISTLEFVIWNILKEGKGKRKKKITG